MGSSATVLIENGGWCWALGREFTSVSSTARETAGFTSRCWAAFLRGKRGSAESGRAGGSAGLLGGFFAVRRRWEAFLQWGKAVEIVNSVGDPSKRGTGAVDPW